MRFPPLVARFLSLVFFLIAGLIPHAAQASDHGGGGGGGEAMVFTLNVGLESYVQFGLVFEVAKPEATVSMNTLKPRIQHGIILLVASKDVAVLRTLQGKKQLIEDIIKLTNEIIGEDESSGIKEVLFSKFLIQ